jgi:hypothetical protein
MADIAKVVAAKRLRTMMRKGVFRKRIVERINFRAYLASVFGDT